MAPRAARGRMRGPRARRRRVPVPLWEGLRGLHTKVVPTVQTRRNIAIPLFARDPDARPELRGRAGGAAARVPVIRKAVRPGGVARALTKAERAADVCLLPRGQLELRLGTGPEVYERRVGETRTPCRALTKRRTQTELRRDVSVLLPRLEALRHSLSLEAHFPSTRTMRPRGASARPGPPGTNNVPLMFLTNAKSAG